jgi:dCTP deaminase
MILTDVEINEFIRSSRIVIDPFDSELVRGASVCLRLGTKFMHVKSGNEIDVRIKETYPNYITSSVLDGSGFVVPAKTFVLASTFEKIALPLDVAGWMSNLSGLARMGLQVIFSNLVSPGYGEFGKTSLTLELFNALDVGVRIHPGMRICHLTFLRSSRPASKSYDAQVGTYANQSGPRASHFHTDFNQTGDRSPNESG